MKFRKGKKLSQRTKKTFIDVRWTSKQRCVLIEKSIEGRCSS